VRPYDALLADHAVQAWLLRLRRAEEACQLFGLADGEAVDVNAHVILFDVLVVPVTLSGIGKKPIACALESDRDLVLRFLICSFRSP
jgi:hypothetical protein